MSEEFKDYISQEESVSELIKIAEAIEERDYQKYLYISNLLSKLS